MDSLDEGRAVGCKPHPGRADGCDRLDAVPAGFFGHGRDRLDCPFHRLLAELPGLVEALAEPRHLGAIDDRPP
jgi:hypothetical protein